MVTGQEAASTDCLTARRLLATTSAPNTWMEEFIILPLFLSKIDSHPNMSKIEKMTALTFSLLAAVCLATAVRPSLAVVIHLSNIEIKMVAVVNPLGIVLEKFKMFTNRKIRIE